MGSHHNIAIEILSADRQPNPNVSPIVGKRKSSSTRLQSRVQETHGFTPQRRLRLMMATSVNVSAGRHRSPSLEPSPVRFKRKKVQRRTDVKIFTSGMTPKTTNLITPKRDHPTQKPTSYVAPAGLPPHAGDRKIRIPGKIT